ASGRRPSPAGRPPRARGRPRSCRGTRAGEDRVPDPLRVGPAVAPELEPLLGLRAVVRDDRPELLPVGLRVTPVAGRLVETEVRVRQRQAELADPWHVDAEELLPQLLARLRLDPPVDVAVPRPVAARAVHLHERPPPAVERLLDQR